MKFSKVLLSCGLIGMAAFITSCSQETFEPNLTPNAPGTMKLVHAPDFNAWSGNQPLSTFGSRADYGSLGRETPDFADWCAAHAVPACPAVPSDVTVVTPDNYYKTQYVEGANYLFTGDVEEYYPSPILVYLADIPKNSNVFIEGNWVFYDSYNLEGASPEEYPNIYVLKDSQFAIDASEEENVYVHNLNIYNYGNTVIYDFDHTVNTGCTIYNADNLIIENNSETTKDLFITQPIYSTGIVNFRGDAYLSAPYYCSKQICVDGKLTLEGSTKVEAGYVNCDEYVGIGSSKLELAADGLLVAGTVAMAGTSEICSAGSEKDYTLGAILTNEILGERKDYTADHVKSEVNAENFARFFRNLDIFVTTTINNTQKKEEIESYVPAGGKTTALLEDEFDASENDYVGIRDVKDIGCGEGYKYIPKTRQTPENPGDNGDDNPGGDDNDNPGTTPGVAAERHDNEVEVNLSVNDSHNEKARYDDSDLWTKLSIHVRKGTDVEIVMPVPATYICASDDFAIVQSHLQNLGVYSGDKDAEINLEGNVHSMTYHIENWTVTLTVEFTTTAQYPEGCIIVRTQGITQELIDYLFEKNGDGINFEVWNYFETEYKENGTVVKREGVSRAALQEYLNSSTVEFLTEEPDYYINAFGTIEDNVKTPGDCTVSIVPAQAGDYPSNFEGEHLNGSKYNKVYVRQGVTPDHFHTSK